ncbi:MAG: hypothetical protein OHK0036_11450 [Bacteroidia bacterium]
MKAHQRDILLIKFSEDIQEHYVVCLTPEHINTEEWAFLGIMITDSLIYDKENNYSFPVNNDMFDKHFLKNDYSKVRLYLINYLPIRAIIKKVAQMKTQYYRKMIDELREKVLLNEI